MTSFNTGTMYDTNIQTTEFDPYPFDSTETDSIVLPDTAVIEGSEVSAKSVRGIIRAAGAAAGSAAGNVAKGLGNVGKGLGGVSGDAASFAAKRFGNLGGSASKNVDNLGSGLSKNLDNVTGVAGKNVDTASKTGKSFAGAADNVADAADDAAGAAKKVTKKSARKVLGNVAEACKKNTKTCVGSILAVGGAAAILADHIKKKEAERQCIQFCVPNKWKELRDGVEEGNAAPTSFEECPNDLSFDDLTNRSHCFQTWNSFTTNRDVVANNIADELTEDTQPFCSAEHYSEELPDSENKGGKCEAFCSETCGDIHRSFGENLFGAIGGVGKILGGITDGLLTCLTDPSDCWDSIVNYIVYIVGFFVVLGVLGIIVNQMFKRRRRIRHGRRDDDDYDRRRPYDY